MIKKILIIFLLFFSWIGSLYSAWSDDLASEDFQIEVKSIFAWGQSDKISYEWWNDTVKSLILIWIDKTMMALWIIALLIMLIWAWYMIIYHGQDNLLSKWKTIFMSWVIALVVALSAQMMVRLVEYLIYTK